MPRGFDDVPGSLPGDVIPQNLDLDHIPFSDFAEQALNNLSEAPFDDGALWRDHLSLTGQVRTFYGSARIKEQWKSYSQKRVPNSFKAGKAQITRPLPDESWIDVSFTFVTTQEGGQIGNSSGTISFIPSQDKTGWKVWMLRTILENFEGSGHPDDPSPILSSENESKALTDQDELEVSVVIVGAGQSGLSLAGRLGALSISYILLEKSSEVGYSWTGKYDTVRQHTIKEMNNLPFDRTYKPSDPDLLPAKTVAEGFQNYVNKYHINVWLDSKVDECETVSGEIGYRLRIKRGDKTHVIKSRHLVLAFGVGSSVPLPPKVENVASFKGTILDIGTFKNSSQWKSKKAIVVGTGTGAHDVAQDMLDNGVASITMIQRSKTPVFPVEWVMAGQAGIYNVDIPTQIADRLASTEPFKISREIIRKAQAFVDPKRYDALERVGFRVDKEAVLNDNIIFRGGGYYIDIGTSARVAAGDIAIKSGDPIKKFLENGLEFESGDVVEADLIVFATGYQRNPKILAIPVVGDEIAKTMKFSVALDEDGELERYMMPVGKRLWVNGGPVVMARWNSRFVALQIQADLMGNPFPDSKWEMYEGVQAKETRM